MGHFSGVGSWNFGFSWEYLCTVHAAHAVDISYTFLEYWCCDLCRLVLFRIRIWSTYRAEHIWMPSSAKCEACSFPSVCDQIAKSAWGEDLALLATRGSRHALFPNQRFTPLLHAVCGLLLLGAFPIMVQFAAQSLFTDPELQELTLL